MEETNANSFLGTEKIGKLMRKYAIPCIISLLVAALYNVVDQVFIANATYLGSYGNAANTVVFPMTVVALALAVMIGDGCCAFVSICLVALLIVEVMPRQLIAIFGAANESVYYTQFAVKAFRIYLCLMPLATVNKATFIYLQSLGKALTSTVLSMVREVLFGVGFALLLPRFFGMDGVLYSMPVSDLLTFVISIVVIRSTYKQLSTKEEISNG